MIARSTDLITNLFTTYTTAETTGTLKFTPAPNAFGALSVTVTVQDAGVDGLFDTADDRTHSSQIPIVINAVNDLPTLNAIANVLVPVNDSALVDSEQVVALTGISRGPANEIHKLRVTAVSSNPSVIPHPGITYVSPDAVGLSLIHI